MKSPFPSLSFVLVSPPKVADGRLYLNGTGNDYTLPMFVLNLSRHVHCVI